MALKKPDVTMTFLPAVNCALILLTMAGSNLADSVKNTIGAFVGNVGVISMGMPIMEM